MWCARLRARHRWHRIVSASYSSVAHPTPLQPSLLVRGGRIYITASRYSLHQDALHRIAGSVSTNDTVLQSHGKDESYHSPMPPQAVVYPTSHEQVVDVVRACAAHAVPIIPFGAGALYCQREVGVPLIQP